MPDKDYIVAEATKMIISQGVRAVRMDDIASDLGMSKRTLYEMFGDKENLVEQCLTWYFHQTGEKYKARMDEAPNIILRFIVLLQDWDTIIETNMKLMDGIKKFYPQVYGRITKHKQEGRLDELKEQLQEGISQGFFLPDIDVDLAVSVFTDSVYGMVLNMEKFEERKISASQAFKYIVTYFFRGMSTEKGITLIDQYITNYKK